MRRRLKTFLLEARGLSLKIFPFQVLSSFLIELCVQTASSHLRLPYARARCEMKALRMCGERGMKVQSNRLTHSLVGEHSPKVYLHDGEQSWVRLRKDWGRMSKQKEA